MEGELCSIIYIKFYYVNLFYEITMWFMYLFLDNGLFLLPIYMFICVGCMPSNKCGQMVCMLRGNKGMP